MINIFYILTCKYNLRSVLNNLQYGKEYSRIENDSSTIIVLGYYQRIGKERVINLNIQ